MRKNTAEVRRLAESIVYFNRSIPSHIEEQWNELKKSCSKMIYTDSGLRPVPSEADPAVWELRIIQSETSTAL